MPEYAVLDKDTIKSEIIPYLSTAKRGFTSKLDLGEIVNAILYKLKSGCQWRLLPIGHLFSGDKLEHNLPSLPQMVFEGGMAKDIFRNTCQIQEPA